MSARLLMSVNVTSPGPNVNEVKTLLRVNARHGCMCMNTHYHTHIEEVGRKITYRTSRLAIATLISTSTQGTMRCPTWDSVAWLHATANTAR